MSLRFFLFLKILLRVFFTFLCSKDFCSKHFSISVLTAMSRGHCAWDLSLSSCWEPGGRQLCTVHRRNQLTGIFVSLRKLECHIQFTIFDILYRLVFRSSTKTSNLSNLLPGRRYFLAAENDLHFWSYVTQFIRVSPSVYQQPSIP